MKIMQVIPYFCFGGAETMCENLTLALKRQGHDVVVVSLYDDHTPIARRMEEAGVRILYLDKKLGLDKTMVPKLRKIMKQERPDAVHTHLDVIKYAALAAKLAGVRRCVHTVHSVADKEAEGRAQKLINGAYYRLGLSTPVGLSRLVQKSIADFYGLDEAQIPMIPNGIDLSRCTPKGDYTLGDQLNLVHVGRFDLPKNHPGLLRVFKKFHDNHPGSHLHLVGDGDSRVEMENLAEQLGIAKWVRFWGMQSDVHPYLEMADIFILPSIYEGNPMTIIEAMATALPIAATNVGGIPDMLTDGETAMLTPCEEDAILAAWERLAADEALREKLGQNALSESVRFSADRMAAAYAKLYEN